MRNVQQTIFNRKRQKEARQSLRNNMPMPEQLLWLRLRGKGCSGFKFRRQHGIGPYIVDFYCPDNQLVIEIDGDSHYVPGAAAHDSQREQYMKKLGIKTIRFTNTAIRENIEAVILKILEILQIANPS